MRVAVAGATGNIGSRVLGALHRDDHEVVAISRSAGIDLVTGEGLAEALTGVEAVIDVTNVSVAERSEALRRFETMTRTLLTAEQAAGVAHHVLLSIAGLHRVEGNAHYAGKRLQEDLVEAGPVPWTIVPATQFHDFASMVTSWTERDGAAPIAPLLIQPVAPDDVAAVLVEVATSGARGRYVEVAGPEPQDLVDMARRSNEALGRTVKLLPTWSTVFGPEMAGDVLLPAEGARITPTTFDDWLASHR
jgi:uncharacterized protein YbjT (DUF2867 family)